MLINFRAEELWYELTWKQKRSRHWWSTTNTILHRKAAWTHAAKAIMRYGLPKLAQPSEDPHVAEYINNLGRFALELAAWLRRFASSMHAYRQTELYQKNYQTSLDAMERNKRQDGSK